VPVSSGGDESTALLEDILSFYTFIYEPLQQSYLELILQHFPVHVSPKIHLTGVEKNIAHLSWKFENATGFMGIASQDAFVPTKANKTVYSLINTN